MRRWSGSALLLSGMALGPHGLNLLSQSALSVLDPLIDLALATLGVFVGLSFNPRRTGDGSLIAVASLEAGLTILGVGAGALIAYFSWLDPGFPPWLPALILGVCAAASVSTADEVSDQRRVLVTRIGDLDELLPIVVGSLLLGFALDRPPAAILSLPVWMSLIAIVIALAGWMLVGQTMSESEQHVFVIGSLLLLGGAASYLSSSALLAGLLAGVVWNTAGNLAQERILRDLRYVQHPLIVLLLLVAGARVSATLEALSLGIVYLVCRMAAKLAGGSLAVRLLGPRATRDLRMSLVSPGIIGIALALNVLHLPGRPDWAVTLLTVVVIGSIASEMISISILARRVSR